MKLGISNIAWNDPWDSKILDLIRSMGLDFIEIAPTKIWNDWKYSKSQVIEFRDFINDHGINLYSMQSSLYNTSDLYLFKDEKHRTLLLDHLKKVDDMCSILGITRVIFGSPKNRVIPKYMSNANALDVAVKFFDELSVNTNNITCLEANARDYNCNFMFTTDQTLEVINLVDRDNIKLHVDLACVTLEHENIKNIPLHLAEHLHISEPYLNDFDNIECNHSEFNDAIIKSRYSKNISIEMRNSDDDDENYNRILNAITFVKNTYDI